MDSPHKDEGRDRRREEALARRVGEALDQIARRDAAECPDAEIIAAYHEKSLAADENARWEGHFATCARCRKVLQVLAASVDAPLDEKEVARLGKLVAVAGAPLVRDTKTAERVPVIRLDWRRRWLAPALGIAAVLAIWFATRAPWRTGDQKSTSILVAEAPQNEPGPNMERRDEQQSRVIAPRNETEADAEALKEMPAKRLPPETPTVDSLAKKSLDDGARARESAPSSSALENTLRDEKKQKAETGDRIGAGVGGGLGSGSGAGVGTGARTGTVGAFSAAPAAAPPPPQPPTATSEAAPMAPAPAPQAQAQVGSEVSNQTPASLQAAPSAKQTVTVTGEAPVVQVTNGTLSGALNESKVKDLPVNGRNYQAMVRFDAPGEFPVQLKTPSEKIVWRAGTGGNIQRSADAGGTWTAQPSPLHEDWLAGSPVSDSVCWIVGRNGAIARTTDGSHWKKIAPPRMAADSNGKLPDWIGVIAVDAKAVTITARDQRRFATENAGKTWKAQ